MAVIKDRVLHLCSISDHKERITIMKKHIKTASAAALAVMLAAANCMPAYAAKNSLTADDIVKAISAYDKKTDKILRANGLIQTSKMRMPVVDTSDLPSKFDLRDVDGKNFVSPVKLQNPWGTCWSFGATAAAETSIAYELGHDYNKETGSDEDAMYNLSEKHLAWFSYTALPEDSEEYPSQSGEGYHFVFNDDAGPDLISRTVYNHGGYMNYATAIYSSGMGPTLEEIVPYKQTVDREYPVITLYVYEMERYGDISCTKTEYDPSETTIEELRKEWTEKGYKEDIDPLAAEQIYSLVSQGITHIDVDKESADKLPDDVMKHFIAFEDNSTGDWTLDESNRFLSIYTLSDGNMLPNPALVGKNGEYIFNQTGVDAIKSELVNGRAVSILFQADQSLPCETLEANNETFMRFIDKDGNPTSDQLAEYWTHYTYDKEYDPTDKNSVNKKIDIDHAVCIVGYDDDFPKEYFNDPKGTIGGNGAFLVKNSWGNKKEDKDGSVISTWGNAGSGYFWLSYYDQSLDIPESFDFDTENTLAQHNIDMYDFLPNSGLNSMSFDNDLYMANVFTTQNNCSVRYIGLETADANIDVDYSVYLLNDDAVSPVDGELIAEASEHFNYAGYHVVDIGKTWYLPKDVKYSIIVKDDADGKSDLFYASVSNDFDYDQSLYEKDDSYDFYVNGIVNPGESFVGTDLSDPGAWTDWSEIVTELRERSLELSEHGMAYDNFPIRSYPQTEPFTIIHLDTDSEKEIYHAGDILKGIVMVENNSGLDFTGFDDFDINVTVGTGEETIKIADISSLKPGKEEYYTYEYTVTEEDVAAGEFTSRVNVKFNGEEIDYGALFEETLTLTVKTGSGSSSVDAATDKNPATGNEIYSVAILAGAAAAIAFASRKRR